MFLSSRLIIMALCMSYLSYCINTKPEESLIGITIGAMIAFYGLTKAPLRNWLLKENKE
ncbi:hypothetical protein [Neisseria sp. Ec49-e6-T10]|uniref:hypothetical protein n=1 Tax=Neisseria sp. Ec49-e6-T10 TaxID=3140744 RepID=UPI003EBB0C2C